jgi:hypothetical protein
MLAKRIVTILPPLSHRARHELGNSGSAARQERSNDCCKTQVRGCCREPEATGQAKAQGGERIDRRMEKG